MNYELMKYYSMKARWCILNSCDPYTSTMAYLKCIEEEINNYLKIIGGELI